MPPRIAAGNGLHLRRVELEHAMAMSTQEVMMSAGAGQIEVIVAPVAAKAARLDQALRLQPVQRAVHGGEVEGRVAAGGARVHLLGRRVGR